MNTEGLKPIDARTMKPGDPVVGVGGKTGRFIAYLPEANEPNQAVVYFTGAGGPYAYTFDGRYAAGTPVTVFFPPDPDPEDLSPGNVDKLRKSQVGEGWRIPAHDEDPDKRARVWRSESWDTRNGYGAYQKHATYRVPIAPIRMVPLEMKDIVLGKTVVRRGGESSLVLQAGRAGVIASPGLIRWDQLREFWEISFDHGVTWVKAEKEEQA